MSNIEGAAPDDIRIGAGVRLAWSPMAQGFKLPDFRARRLIGLTATSCLRLSAAPAPAAPPRTDPCSAPREVAFHAGEQLERLRDVAPWRPCSDWMSTLRGAR